MLSYTPKRSKHICAFSNADTNSPPLTGPTQGVATSQVPLATSSGVTLPIIVAILLLCVYWVKRARWALYGVEMWGGGGGGGGMTKEYGCAAICGQVGSTLCYFQCNSNAQTVTGYVFEFHTFFALHVSCSCC